MDSSRPQLAHRMNWNRLSSPYIQTSQTFGLVNKYIYIFRIGGNKYLCQGQFRLIEKPFSFPPLHTSSLIPCKLSYSWSFIGKECYKQVNASQEKYTKIQPKNIGHRLLTSSIRECIQKVDP